MVKLYVEGGGDHNNAAKRALRKGFSGFLLTAGVSQRPRVVACGGRQQAYESYVIAVKNGEQALLLVDSEDPVSPACSASADKEKWDPWLHLAQQKQGGERWEKPSGADLRQCHLMVLCMETWILADRETLSGFYGKGFNPGKLPQAEIPLESLTKETMNKALSEATKGTTNGKYHKGKHSFALIGQIDPKLVCAASPWAQRFIETLRSGRF